MFWIVLDIKVILANMVFSQVLRIIFFTFLTFFLPLSCTEIKLVWRLQTEAFSSLLEMGNQNKKDHQHLSLFVKKKFLC